MRQKDHHELEHAIRTYWLVVGYFLTMAFSILVPILSGSFTFFDPYSTSQDPIIQTIQIFFLMSFLSSFGAIVVYHAFVLAVAPRLWKIGTFFALGVIVADFILFSERMGQYSSTFGWVAFQYILETFFRLYFLIPLFLFFYLASSMIKKVLQKSITTVFNLETVLYSLLCLVFLLGISQVPTSLQPITDQYDSEAWYYLHRGMPFQFAGAISNISATVPWPLIKSLKSTGTEWIDPAWHVVYSIPELLKQVFFLLPFALIMGISLAHSQIPTITRKFIILSILGLTIYLFWSFSGI